MALGCACRSACVENDNFLPSSPSTLSSANQPPQVVQAYDQLNSKVQSQGPLPGASGKVQGQVPGARTCCAGWLETSLRLRVNNRMPVISCSVTGSKNLKVNASRLVQYILKVRLRYFCQLAVTRFLLLVTTKDVTILTFVFKKLSIFNQHALDCIVGRPYYLKTARVKSMENVG